MPTENSCKFCSGQFISNDEIDGFEYQNEDDILDPRQLSCFFAVEKTSDEIMSFRLYLWFDRNWNPVFSYYPKYCPNCGRKLRNLDGKE